jgi:cytidylate kinase
MSIITISRGSYSPAKDVAEKVAQNLGFECISPNDVVEASDQFNVPEIKLLQAVRDAPSIMDRFTFGKEKYIAYFQAALLEHFQKDNVVYHGLAGHYFIKQVSHVLKVRIISEEADRVKLVLEREHLFELAASALEGIATPDVTHPKKHPVTSKDEAVRVLKESDDARKKWGLHLYGIDTNDPSLYDLVIHVKKLDVADAADIVCRTARLGHFQATAESKQAMDDLLLAARVRVSLIEQYPRVNVTANAGDVFIGLEGASSREEDEIRNIARQCPGVKKIDMESRPFVTPD